jgi:hypothetical protein
LFLLYGSAALVIGTGKNRGDRAGATDYTLKENQVVDEIALPAGTRIRLSGDHGELNAGEAACAAERDQSVASQRRAGIEPASDFCRGLTA